ncbi:hypothetical protein ACFSMW_19575 [Virgibacillus halophilus]|uniref:PH domain-containing protein n=1 Tax=Tigheibacillus halophilus TaxID=361280 RepID=A0ABU5C9Y5_9BACI|nr:hypothetical protein [Virgibacillus halophilus]
MNERTILERSLVSKWKFFLSWAVPLGLLGWCLPFIGQWSEEHLFDSMTKASKWLLMSESTYMLWLRPSLGVLIALWSSKLHFANQVKMEVTDAFVTISYEKRTSKLKRSEIAAVWLDINHMREIVFLNENGKEMYREFLPNMPKEKIREAFLQHNYPWKDEDPYYGKYVLWEEGTADVGELETISLTARQKYLKEGEYHKANKIQRQLGREGIMITDKGRKQYIRVVEKK